VRRGGARAQEACRCPSAQTHRDAPGRPGTPEGGGCMWQLWRWASRE
jgi:hypothetical protein